MKYIVKFGIPVDKGNEKLSSGEFGAKMQQYMEEVGAEAVYFTTVFGQRGGYMVVNMDDASEMPKIAEPLFLWLEADVEVFPVMTPDDLMKGHNHIEGAAKKWG